MTHHDLSSLLCLLSVEYSVVFLAVVADLVSGLRRARRERRPCTSCGLRRSVSKLSSYYLALFCLTLVDAIIVMSILTLGSLGRATVVPFPYLTSLGTVSLALIEAKSIAENSPHRTDILNAVKLILRLKNLRFRN